MAIFRTLLVAAIAFGIDQFSKWYVVWHLDLTTLQRIEVLPPFLNFRMAWNRGINFGILGESSRWLLVGVALAISAGILWWVRNRPDRFHTALAGLVVGGALGNVLDRILHGAVVDFLNMSCCGIDNPYAFNLADVFIFAGAIGLILFARDETPTAPGR